MPAAEPPPQARAATAPQAWRLRLETWLTHQWQAPEPTGWAPLLQLPALLYGALAAMLALPWRLGWRRPATLPVPVLVVGNLVAGGAGKTPTVLALLPLLQAMGHRPGVVSRGHGRRSHGLALVQPDSDARLVGDEPLLIRRRSGVPVAVGADRSAAAQALCAAHPDLTLLVSDDGLQHHRLARQAQVLVFDERGTGNGRLLPAGPLRQRWTPRPPAHSLVLYTGGRASTPWPGHLGHRALAGVLPLAAWWAGRPPDAAGFAALGGRPVLACAALARPEPFFQMLEAQGLHIHRLPLPDHAAFSPLPWPAETTDVVLTEKDAVKLRPGHTGAARVWVATLDFQPEPGFVGALRHLADARFPPPPAPHAVTPASLPP